MLADRIITRLTKECAAINDTVLGGRCDSFEEYRVLTARSRTYSHACELVKEVAAQEEETPD